MSCQHGNWPPCDQCDELDEKWDAGYAAGCKKSDKLALLLRECEAAICLLGGARVAAATIDAIHKAIEECKP